MQTAHCRNNFYREFAYKTLPGDPEYPHNELMRVKNPVKNAHELTMLVDAYWTRPGLYISVYSFSELTSEGSVKYDSAKINRIYLDFDCKEDPQKAIDEALLTIRSLTKHKIYPHCYFSGGKGIAMFIDFKTVDLKPDKKKDILKFFFDLVIESVLEDFGHSISTLDPQIRGDIARISRLPNTRHSSGYYCIPLHISELKKGLGYIKTLAAVPREEFDLDKTIVDNMILNSEVPQIILNIEKQISVNKFKTVKVKRCDGTPNRSRAAGHDCAVAW